LGFQVVALPDTLRIRMARLHITALMQSQSIPWFKRHVRPRESVQVKAVWISRAGLLRTHGPAS